MSLPLVDLTALPPWAAAWETVRLEGRPHRGGDHKGLRYPDAPALKFVQRLPAETLVVLTEEMVRRRVSQRGA